MSSSVQQWLDSLEGHPSCLACVVRPPGRASLQRQWDSEVKPEALEHSSRSVVDMFRILRLHRLPSQYLQWTFERGVLHCLLRADDWLLVVLARREPALPEGLLAEWGQQFMQLASIPES